MDSSQLLQIEVTSYKQGDIVIQSCNIYILFLYPENYNI